ncbi:MULTISPECIES: fumarylacetoacetate hydrolase family protein [Arthrobacter]|uniref:FAA hydrolase family protein n=1 Tax=Arthrobacter terricola TaxID=2547396 RepID=A0A4R5KIK4_9MICC|nr:MULTISPECIES: fumarylacetoacetate hydrolase family protein [Arthrobacter]MBT8159234.1 fumarylacetoacetate hydrolase family protein [Arthrobacter sp. GN70]TDF94932.1 FAA hydrolase family protein [Arthrobacter terricola]
MNSLASPLWDVQSVLVPIVGQAQSFPVRRIYCVGRNYVEHIREMKEGDERDAPFFFQKPTDAIVSSGGRVPYPPLTEDFQYEGELVVAIGTGGSDIPGEKAEDHIFGYSAGIDMTRRDRQREAFKSGQPWEIGKGFDHSAPCGAITTVQERGSLEGADLVLSVNGEERQRTGLGLMIWNVPEIIENLSRQYRLERGDLIFTGTPAGVGAVTPGDVIRAEVTGLSVLEVTVA